MALELFVGLGLVGCILVLAAFKLIKKKKLSKKKKKVKDRDDDDDVECNEVHFNVNKPPPSNEFSENDDVSGTERP